MSFNIKYDIPSDLFYEVQDRLLLVQINKIKTKILIKYLFKAIKENKYRISFINLKDKAVMGTYWDETKIIHLSGNIPIVWLPGVLIHEILHSIFPQLEIDQNIINLEKKILKVITRKQVEKLLREVFNGRWWYKDRWQRDIPSEYDHFKSERTVRGSVTQPIGNKGRRHTA